MDKKASFCTRGWVRMGSSPPPPTLQGRLLSGERPGFPESLKNIFPNKGPTFPKEARQRVLAILHLGREFNVDSAKQRSTKSILSAINGGTGSERQAWWQDRGILTFRAG